jgi:hypothetical protein
MIGFAAMIGLDRREDAMISRRHLLQGFSAVALTAPHMRRALAQGAPPGPVVSACRHRLKEILVTSHTSQASQTSS